MRRQQAEAHSNRKTNIPTCNPHTALTGCENCLPQTCPTRIPTKKSERLPLGVSESLKPFKHARMEPGHILTRLSTPGDSAPIDSMESPHFFLVQSLLLSLPNLSMALKLNTRLLNKSEKPREKSKLDLNQG